MSKSPLEDVQLSFMLSNYSSLEITKMIVSEIGWEIFEYPELIPDQNSNGEPTLSEVPFYGIKNNEGKVIFKGTPFKDDLFKSIDFTNYHFMGVLLRYLSSNNYTVKIKVDSDSASVDLYNKDQEDSYTRVSSQANLLPRTLCEAFLLNKKKD